jgi:lipopolysaccharide export system permease protein
MTKKLYFYIVRKFLFTLFLVVLSVSLLLAMINIFELLGKVADKPISFGQIILLDVLQIPSFIESISPFLVMIASMITLSSFSVRSEITVMRASGLSFLRIIFPIAVSAFVVGVFCLFIFSPMAISASKKFNLIEGQILVEKEKFDLLTPIGGIWLRQENILSGDQEIIIHADKIYRTTLKMKNVELWFFNQDQEFYKKINANYMILKDGYWHLGDLVINDRDHINKKILNLKIETNLKADFISKKILNNFEDVRLFSIYDLPNLIANLKDSGFPPRKFIVQYYSIITKPFLFVAMSLIAAFFSVNNVRSKNNIVWFICGIMLGLVLYVSLIIVQAFGSSGLIPVFLSTWMTAIILLAISMLLIFRKEGSY